MQDTHNLLSRHQYYVMRRVRFTHRICFSHNSLRSNYKCRCVIRTLRSSPLFGRDTNIPWVPPFPACGSGGVALPGRQAPGMALASPQGWVHGVPGNGTPTATLAGGKSVTKPRYQTFVPTKKTQYVILCALRSAPLRYIPSSFCTVAPITKTAPGTVDHFRRTTANR